MSRHTSAILQEKRKSHADFHDSADRQDGTISDRFSSVYQPSKRKRRARSIFKGPLFDERTSNWQQFRRDIEVPKLSAIPAE